MKRVVIAVVVIGAALAAGADTTLTFGFDNNATDNGIQYGGVDQLIDFTEAVSATGQVNFNLLDGASALVGFSIGAVGDLSSFSGTMTPFGGDFYMGASGGGIDSGTGSDYFSAATEYWTFTFSADVLLEAVDYYAPDPAQQTILINGSPISGSPFSSDFSGDSFAVSAGDSLTFGYDASGTGTYGLDTFTITVVPEPATIGLIGLGGLMALIVRRSSRK